MVDTSWSGDATFADLNGDLLPDVYVLSMQGDDHYYENGGGDSFVDRTSETFPKTSWGAMGVQFLDYNNDGLLDLFTTDMHSDMTEIVEVEREKGKSTDSVRRTWADEHLQGGDNNIFGNSFYENRGGGEFVEVSDRIGAENFWPWGLSVGDLNADGWIDAFITSSMNYKFRYLYTVDPATGSSNLVLTDPGEFFAGIALSFVSPDDLFVYEVSNTDDLFVYDATAQSGRAALALNILSSFNAGRGDLGAAITHIPFLVRAPEVEITRIDNDARLTWKSAANHVYRVWHAALPQGPWSDSPFIAVLHTDDEATAAEENALSETQRFYTIEATLGP